MKNSVEHVDAVRRNSRDCRYSAEKQNSIRARISNRRKTLKLLASLRDWPHESRAQIAAELVLHSHGNFFEALGANFGNHSSSFQCSAQLCRLRPQQLLWFDADLTRQISPSLRAGRVASRIPAVPPDK